MRDMFVGGDMFVCVCVCDEYMCVRDVFVCVRNMCVLACVCVCVRDLFVCVCV